MIDQLFAHQPKLVFIDLITQLQDLLTNMVLFSGNADIYAELFELAVTTLGHLHRVNFHCKAGLSQLEAKDFINPAVSQTLDFKGPVQNWSKRILAKVRNGGKTIPLVGRAQDFKEPFCVISHPWLFTTDAKQRILNEHVKFEQMINGQLWKMKDIWVAQA